MMLAACFSERAWGERSLAEQVHAFARDELIELSEDWDEDDEPDFVLRSLPAIRIGSIREGLPDSPRPLSIEAYGNTASEVLEGPFSGPRMMSAFELLDAEIPGVPSWGLTRLSGPRSRLRSMYSKRLEFNSVLRIADACSKQICDEVIRDSTSHNYIYGQDVDLVRWVNRSDLRSMESPILPGMGINTTDIRNFGVLDDLDRPETAAYSEDEDSIPLYMGHLSSGTEGTLLWIRWVALKIAHFYDFEEGWENQPAILLIDEIENHLHPRWQRRVIPTLKDAFPKLQIFATTHSPFVVAGVEGGAGACAESGW